MADQNAGYKAILSTFAALAVLKRAASDSLARDKRLLWTPAGVAALTIVLRYFFASKEAKLITDFSKLGRKVKDAEEKDFDEYDVIICGGGTAGCVLASRLTEDPSIKVLVLEAGSSGKALFYSRAPSGFAKLYFTPHAYNLWTTPQQSAGGKKKYWPRGKLLGGCSSINAQMAQYGAPSDFDEWAEVIGDKSWSFDEFRKYIAKFENFIHDPQYPLVKTSDRGSHGPVRIGYHSHMTPMSEEFVKACIQVGIPFNPDFNTLAGTRGVNRVMTYIDEKGERVSTESAYLTDDVLARPNLKVATGAHVTRILFKEIDSQTRAVGVEFANTENGPRYRARARKEVIVCGGAVHSPQILLLSGVGPAGHLTQHDIPVVHDLPGVGEHLIDHPSLYIRFQSKLPLSMNFLRPQSFTHVAAMTSALAKYHVTGRGPLSSNLAEAASFLRADDPLLFPPSEYPTPIEDSNSGPKAPDLELIFSPIAAKEHQILLPGLHTCMIQVALLRPTSKGTLRLKSASPWEQPVIDPNYCQTQHDVDVLVRGVKLALRVAHTAPFTAVLDETDEHTELDHKLHLKSDAELEQIVRERVETIYHPASTCRMAPEADGGVVDAQQRVYGIPNLRVCDVSTFPWLVSGHPTGACIASAEKLADIMKIELRRS